MFIHWKINSIIAVSFLNKYRKAQLSQKRPKIPKAMLKHKFFLKEEVSCSWPGKHFPEGLYIHIHQETTFCEKMPDDTHVGKEKINECCSRKSCKCLLVLRRKSMTLVLLHFHDNLEDEQWAYMRLGRAHLQLFIVIKKLYLEIFIDNIGEMFF